ncbi:MAG: hypothetical protein HRU09_07600 [Oligoflexales bacterium]|nr:hypothetical protein [Oligoflexales bacterium]
MKHILTLLLLYFATEWTHLLADPIRFECTIAIDDFSQTLPIPLEKSHFIKGRWIKPKKLKSKKVSMDHDIRQSKDAFLLEKANDDSLLELCYQQAVSHITIDTLYFVKLESVKAFRANDSRCHGHDVIIKTKSEVKLYHADKTKRLRSLLDKYNFAVVLDGLIYRSKLLGKKGMRELWTTLKREGVARPKSIASIHVMGFGGVGGSYNLEELEESKKKGVSFLHSYHYDKRLTVYMDGTDPSKIIENDPHHGNIYTQETVNRFIPDEKIQKLLKIDQSIAENRYLSGDTEDFLQSVENMIDAPWPLLIHCKGGRHKTGMFAIVFEYLAYKASMKAEYSEEVSIPAYKNRFANWWSRGHGSLWYALFGGPFHENHLLRPAETNYAYHNLSIFRRKNIDFVRGLISGELLFNQELVDHWHRIEKKFKDKIAKFPRTYKII